MQKQKQLRKFIVIKEHQGRGDNYNHPSLVDLPVGTELTATDYEANERGHLFFKINNTAARVMPYSVKARHPYDTCEINFEYLEEITPGRDFRHVKDSAIKKLLQDDRTVLVTKEIISIHNSLRALKELHMKDFGSGIVAKLDWKSYCHRAFFNDYAAVAYNNGLNVNNQTFNSLIFSEIPAGLAPLKSERIPQVCAFNPTINEGKNCFFIYD